jgi:hypothetical protein
LPPGKVIEENGLPVGARCPMLLINGSALHEKKEAAKDSPRYDGFGGMYFHVLFR